MVGSVWYWCIDQNMAQRVTCAKNIRHGKGGTIFASFLKLIPPLIVIFPGMAAKTMYQQCITSNGKLFPLWCEKLDGADADRAYLNLITRVFPSGIVGLILLSMLVSMMSALSSVFNSAAALFTLDIYKNLINPKASPIRVKIVGRLFTIVMVGLSMAWLVVIRNFNNGI